MKWQDRQAVFDKTIGERGLVRMDTGMLDYKSFEARLLRDHREQVKHTVRHIQKTNNFPPHFPPVYFDFIDDPRMNALAFEGDGGMYLGIFTGAVYLLTDLFYRIYSHPRMHPEGAELEVENFYHTQTFTSNYNELVHNRPPGGLANLKPKSASRTIIAESAAITAFRVLVLHELAHLLRGHCAYRKTHLGLPFLLELENIGHAPANEDFLIRQALELDADAFAIRYSYSVFARNLPIGGAVDAGGRKDHQVLFELIFASLALFVLLFDFKSKSTNTVHPHPAHRAVFVKATLETNLRTYGSQGIIPHIDAMMFHAFQDIYGIITVFNGNTLPPYFVESINNSNSPEGIAYRNMLLNKMTEIMPEVIACAPKA